MRSFIAAAALLQSFVHLASAQVSNDTSSACPQQGGVHIIVARASLEPVGYGTIGAVKDAVLAMIPGSTAEFVIYRATLDQYTISESEGVIGARQLINAYIENCPGQPLVVMGYSQGAQVTADSLVGQQVKNFPVNDTINEPLPESTLARVAAVIMMGDPSATLDESFHVGNSTKNAIFPRENVDNFKSADLGSRTQSYCDDGDPYCASGLTLIVHLRYVAEYGTDAASFVVKNVASWYAASWYAAHGGSSAGTATTGLLPKPTASASRAPSGTASRMVPTASASLSSVPASASASAASTAAPSAPVSTGAASSLEIAGASFGAIAAGLAAFLL